MADVPGVTTCPSCGDDLAPGVVTDERPIQVLSQSCSACSYTTHIGVCWYPDEHYEVIGTLAECVNAECTRCDQTAERAVIDNRTTVATYYCTDCLRDHHQNTHDVVQEHR